MITSAKQSRRQRTTLRITRRLISGVAVSAASAGFVLAAAPTADAMPIPPAATASDLSVRVSEAPTRSAGHFYLDLVYTNVSNHDVLVKGYAGISVVADGNGTQVGRPAVWLRNRRAVTVRLEPGDRATEIVSVADAGDFGPTSTHTVRADGFRIYVPGSRAAKFVPYTFTASTLDVAQLQAYPIGARI